MQFMASDQENLKSYITDLKKASVANKKTRGNVQNSKATAPTNLTQSNQIKGNNKV